MSDPDTEMRKGPPSFPTTHWTIIRNARDAGSAAYRDSLEKLMEIYWRPIYVFVRSAWSRSNEDAKDLTQEFLARLAEGGLLDKYEKEKGRFRAYLKGALRHFLMDAEKTAARKKRGGGALLLSLDFESVGPKTDVAGPQESPEALFDREWADALMREAMAELQRRLRRDGREVCYEVFDRYESPPAGSPELSYGDVGALFGLSAAEVKAHLGYARLLMKKILKERVSDTVSSEEDLYRELKELFES